MSQRTNTDYLRNNQYKDGSNLNARINLHRRFSTNPADWFRWVFEHLELPIQATCLELGCGPGILWMHNLDRISNQWRIHLSDFSPGMLLEAIQSTISLPNTFNFTALDAQAIPYPSGYFDLVIANHMLYHIPDRQKAFCEIQRILKSTGRVIAATNGLHHMTEIRKLRAQLGPSLAGQTDHAWGVSEFTIENGVEQLIPWFDNIRVIPFVNSLEVTEAEPLLDYILSMTTTPVKDISPQTISTFTQLINQRIAALGSIHITISTAIFIAYKKMTSTDHDE